ncbi:PAS domain S-box protein [Rhodovulum sulfidophilum]|nr:PAS domain S-box protein [Rhodovulum sulfidophilum]
MSLLRPQKSLPRHPVVTGMIVFLTVLTVANGAITIEKRALLEAERDLVAQEVMTFAARLQTEINSNVYLANGLIAFIAVSKAPAPQEMKAAMASLHGAGRNIRNIGLAPGNRIEYVFPNTGNSSVIGLYYPDLKDQWPAVKRAIDRKTTIVAGPINLKQGGVGLISRTPVFLEDGSYWGILSLVLDAESVFAQAGILTLQNNLNIALRLKADDGEPDRVFKGEAELFAPTSIIRDIVLPGLVWQIAATPREGWTQSLGHLQLLRGLSLLLAVFLGGLAAGRQRQRLDLARTEKRLASVTKAIRDAIIVVDDSGDIVELNAAAETMFGKPTAQAKSMPVAEMFQVETVLANTSVQTVVQGWRADGTELCLEVSSSTVDMMGNLKTIYSIRDVGDRMAIENALRKSEERFRNITSQVPGVIYQWQEGPGDRRGFTYVSPRSHEILGLEADALVEDWSLFQIHPDEIDAWVASISHSISTGEDWQFEGRFLRGDETRWWRAFSRPQRSVDDPDGTVIFTGVIFDVTSVKAAQQALIAKERELAVVLESALDGIISIDMRGVILSANAAAAQIFQYRAEELVGQNVSMLMPDAIASRTERYLDSETVSVIRKVVGMSRTVMGRRRNGEEFPVELSVAQTLAGCGSTYTGVLRDITDRVAAERELEAARFGLEQKANDLEILADERDRARRDAERASEAKSSFLAVMSHELRTPMTGILGIADLLLSETQSARHRKWINTLRRSGVSLLSLLDDILDFSKIEAGKLTLESIAFLPDVVMADVCELLSSTAQEKGLDFKMEQRISPSPTLIGDPMRLQQILLNLTTNALKFTDKGGVTLSLGDAEKLPDGRWRMEFEVADTGIGIPSELQANLFQPFTQAEASTTRRFGGTGLGLAISARLAEAMDGEIDVSSVEGQGSVFRLTIVLPEAAEMTGNISHPARLALGPAHDRALNLLIAEDNETNRLLLNDALEMCGHSVTTVENGAEAVAVVKKNDFDAVIMDMQMPVMDGVTAARLMQAEDGNGPPIILLTADALSRKSFEKKNVFAAVLTKPIDWGQLFSALNEFARRDGEASADAQQHDKPSNFIGASKNNSDPGEEESSTEPPTLSLEWLDVLRQTIPPDRVNSIFASLIEKLDLQSRDLRARLSAGDLEGAERTLHSLLGLSRQFGLGKVAQCCQNISITSESRDVAHQSPLLERFDIEISSARRALKTFIETQSKPFS